MPESSHHQPSQEHPHAFAIGIHDVRTGPPHEGELGEGVLLRTDRGDIQAILHPAPEAQYGVIWVGGARGGFGRPGQGAYARLADVLRRDRISSLRLCYRHPNVLPECALDVLAGVAYLTYCRAQPVVLVGHSFGGAVVITAGAVHAHVAGVVALAPQTSGAQLAGQLAPRPLLVVHGKADTRLPYSCGVQRKCMSIAPEEFVPYMSAAFDGMLAIAEELGDARLNQRPQHMPNTSTPCAILTHCIGLTRYWLGTVIAGRQIPRDRDAEFSARGTVADLRQAVQQIQQEIQADITHVQGDQPSAFPAAVRPQHQAWTQGHCILQCYKELAQHHGHMELTRDIMLGRGPAS